MRRRFLAVVMALGLVAACGGDGGSVSSTTTPSGTATTAATATTSPGSGLGGEGGCTVTVGGDLDLEWSGPDDVSAFASDYWFTEDELRQQYEFLAGSEGGTFEDLMAGGGQVFTFFLFNCQGPDGQLVSLSVDGDATRDDFAMGPGTYPISGGLLGGGTAGPSDFLVVFATGPDDIWALEGTGTVTITAWDRSHLTGTYTFDAVESFTDTPRRVTVTGDFELFCRSSSEC